MKTLLSGSPVDGTVETKSAACRSWVYTATVWLHTALSRTWMAHIWSWWEWFDKQRKPRVKLSVRSPRRFSRRLPAGIKNSGRRQSSPPAESVWLRVCASLSARVCTFMCARSVCLIDWPPSTPFKGKTRELSQRITRRRMQQLMCASCTVFLYLETACTHGGWWPWFDQMFLLLCFQTHLSDKAKS